MGRITRELSFDPPYDGVFRGLPRFKTFADAEDTLRNLERLRETYVSARDEKGLNYCRQIGLEARRRAELISRNRRVSPTKREAKKEIALWFQVWLETPDILASWLHLRRMTGEFERLLNSEGPDADTLRRMPTTKER